MKAGVREAMDAESLLESIFAQGSGSVTADVSSVPVYEREETDNTILPFAMKNRLHLQGLSGWRHTISDSQITLPSVSSLKYLTLQRGMFPFVMDGILITIA